MLAVTSVVDSCSVCMLSARALVMDSSKSVRSLMCSLVSQWAINIYFLSIRWNQPGAFPSFPILYHAVYPFFSPHVKTLPFMPHSTQSTLIFSALPHFLPLSLRILFT